MRYINFFDSRSKILRKIRKNIDTLAELKEINDRTKTYTLGTLEKRDEISFNKIFANLDIIDKKSIMLELIFTHISLFKRKLFNVCSFSVKKLSLVNVNYYRCYIIGEERYIIKSKFCPLIYDIYDFKFLEETPENDSFYIFIKLLLEKNDLKSDKDSLDSFSDFLFNEPIFDFPIKYCNL